MTENELLKQNGWTIECISPFEIRHTDGSFATMNAAYAILHGIRVSLRIHHMTTLRYSYMAGIIDKDTFIDKLLQILDDALENTNS